MSNDDLMILRRVDGLSPATLVELAKDEGQESYFPDFVDNDRPRDGTFTADIVEHTKGFAVANRDGEVLKKFKALDEAENARANAKVTFEVQVDGLDEDEDNGEE